MNNDDLSPIQQIVLNRNSHQSLFAVVSWGCAASKLKVAEKH
jgi:hypothetical protein